MQHDITMCEWMMKGRGHVLDAWMVAETQVMGKDNEKHEGKVHETVQTFMTMKTERKGKDNSIK